MGFDGVAGKVTHAAGDDDEILSAAFKNFVRFDETGVGGRVINQFVDGAELAGGVDRKAARNRVKPGDEDVFAQGFGLNRAREAQGNAGVLAEAVKLIQEGNFGAIAGTGIAIGQGKIHPAAGALAGVGRREIVAGEGAGIGIRGVEINLRVGRPGGDGEEGEPAKTHAAIVTLVARKSQA